MIIWDPASKTTIEAQGTNTGIGQFSYASGPTHHIFEIWRIPVCQGAVGQPVGPVVWWLTGRESRWIGDDESGGSAGAVFAA